VINDRRQVTCISLCCVAEKVDGRMGFNDDLLTSRLTTYSHNATLGVLASR